MADNTQNGQPAPGMPQAAQHVPPPIAPNPAGAVGHGQAVVAPQGMAAMPPHLVGLMTNPALAAAAVGSPLFPPAAMLTNPGAIYAMPDAFASNNAIATHNAAIAQATQAHGAAQVVANGGNAVVYATQAGHPVHQGHQLQQAQQMTGLAATPNSFGTNGAVTNSSSMYVHKAAADYAAQAVADKSDPVGQEKDPKRRKKDLTPQEKAKQNRDRNREHARSTRLRKKAYIQKLKELVEGLHAERTEEVRQRRVAIQHLAEMQNVRRSVIRSFLRFHSNYERDNRKWGTILEDTFWLKQPVTPYRCFRRSEIEQECRISRGVDSVIADAASISTMIEGVGSRTTRWMQIKREDFFLKEEERTGRRHMPRDIIPGGDSRHNGVSSLSSSSNGGSSEEEANRKKHQREVIARANAGLKSERKSDSGSTEGQDEQLHDYHAQPLPDPKMVDSDPTSTLASEDSPEESNSSADDTKRASTDASSGDDSAAAIKNPPRCDDKKETMKTSGSVNSKASNLPSNIAKRGGISHSVIPVPITTPSAPLNPRLSTAPAVQLPHFQGLGKAPQSGVSNDGLAKVSETTNTVGGDGSSDQMKTGTEVAQAVLISGDVETSSSNSSGSRPQIRAYFHLNEDDMIVMEDILMCPFVFRTQDAVQCGALAECVMPGMLRGHFSPRNKLVSLEMMYDAMGFMQQLERASGSEMTAQIIPGSLEMALSPSTVEARVITLATAPFKIVNVNEPWTKLTKYTQMEVEGMDLFKLLDGDVRDDQAPKLPYDLDEIGQGRCACTTRLHYDKNGREFVDFLCSYPLTNSNDEVTHVLHVSKDLPPLQASIS